VELPPDCLLMRIPAKDIASLEPNSSVKINGLKEGETSVDMVLRDYSNAKDEAHTEYQLIVGQKSSIIRHCPRSYNPSLDLDNCKDTLDTAKCYHIKGTDNNGNHSNLFCRYNHGVLIAERLQINHKDVFGNGFFVSGPMSWQRTYNDSGKLLVCTKYSEPELIGGSKHFRITESAYAYNDDNIVTSTVKEWRVVGSEKTLRDCKIYVNHKFLKSCMPED